MALTLGEWSNGFSAAALHELAILWNANAARRHAFYPWTGEMLAKLLSSGGKGIGRLLEARVDGRLVGVSHASVINEDGYPLAGSVEMLMVDEAYRKKGIGSALLRGATAFLDSQRPRPEFIDALGAWPFGYLYNVLADGSERSGVFLNDSGLYRLFRRAGFEPVRKSYVMRADANNPLAAPRPLPPGAGFYVAKRGDRTWLDRVFRGRELWDHDLIAADGQRLSRSIFGLMEGESRREGKVVFSLFGVNTPADVRGKGYAGINLSHLLAHIAQLGGDLIELHVYADNLPALALYRRLGFRQLHETMMMHARW